MCGNTRQRREIEISSAERHLTLRVPTLTGSVFASAVSDGANTEMTEQPHIPDAIRVHGLTKTYGPDVLALAGIPLHVRKGEIFGFLGPNGAGKSTTVRILTTLSWPTSGHAEVMGIDVAEQPDAVRRVIGVVAQKSGGDPSATGRENLLLQGQLHSLERQQLERRVDYLLERFGLADAANRPAKTYSGGMNRKLDIAMGLIHQPEVLFLDEPTTGLDPESRAQMWRDVEALSRHEGVTIFLTTHYLEEADRLADRIAIIDQGQIVVEGEPDRLKAELEGDALHVELADEATVDAARSTLSTLDGLGQIVVEDRTLHARVANGRTTVPKVFSALDDTGIRAEAVTMSRPSLDDVYLRYAGRSFRAGQAEQVEEEEN
jgi:ABC-2 type transport system ATP-binding protein